MRKGGRLFPASLLLLGYSSHPCSSSSSFCVALPGLAVACSTPSLILLPIDGNWIKRKPSCDAHLFLLAPSNSLTSLPSRWRVRTLGRWADDLGCDDRGTKVCSRLPAPRRPGWRPWWMTKSGCPSRSTCQGPVSGEFERSEQKASPLLSNSPRGSRTAPHWTVSESESAPLPVFSSVAEAHWRGSGVAGLLFLGPGEWGGFVWRTASHH